MSGNDTLSQDRANAVAAVLTNNYGIAADRISAKGYGASQPVADNKTVEGQTPSPADVTVGCEFASRCPYVADICRTQTIELRTFKETHEVRCIRLDSIGQLPPQEVKVSDER